VLRKQGTNHDTAVACRNIGKANQLISVKPFGMRCLRTIPREVCKLQKGSKEKIMGKYSHKNDPIGDWPPTPLWHHVVAIGLLVILVFAII
jgi:hypothetical protein